MNAYSPLNEKDKQSMLAAIGAASVEELFKDTPKEKRLKTLSLPAPLSEIELNQELKALAAKNFCSEGRSCFLGAGSYNHFVPAAVKHLEMRSEFYTAYTPYQPEISQGMLQAIFEYQSLLCALTGMDVANASLYDGATALAEATTIACHKTSRQKILVSKVVPPAWREVLKTYTTASGRQLEEIPYNAAGQTDLDALKKMLSPKVAGVVVPQINFFGIIEDLAAAKDVIQPSGALFIATFDPIALGIIAPPGELGADIAVGEGQALGINPSFGGPGLGLFACKKDLLRLIPGRLSGQTVDGKGRRGFVLTLQAREQHIRREKASSNICSNEALCALTATIYLSLMGKNGLKKVAKLCLSKANYLRRRFAAGDAANFSLAFTHGRTDAGLSRAAGATAAPIFKEFVVKCPAPPCEINKKLMEKNIIGGLDLEKFYPELKNHWLLCVTEVLSKEGLDLFFVALR
jgi:glycine dehydrogenase subunit 1